MLYAVLALLQGFTTARENTQWNPANLVTDVISTGDTLFIYRIVHGVQCYATLVVALCSQSYAI